MHWQISPLVPDANVTDMHPNVSLPQGWTAAVEGYASASTTPQGPTATNAFLSTTMPHGGERQSRMCTNANVSSDLLF